MWFLENKNVAKLCAVLSAWSYIHGVQQIKAVKKTTVMAKMKVIVLEVFLVIQFSWALKRYINITTLKRFVKSEPVHTIWSGMKMSTSAHICHFGFEYFYYN